MQHQSCDDEIYVEGVPESIDLTHKNTFTVVS